MELTDEQIVHMANTTGLAEEMWFGPNTPPSAKDCLPELRKFAEAILASIPPNTPVEAGKVGVANGVMASDGSKPE